MADQKISKNKEKKAKLIAEILEKVEKSKAMVFLNYQGLTHQQLEGLKKSLKANNAELAVTKNTLLKIALQQAKLLEKDLDEATSKNFDQPTAALFAYADEVSPLKEVTKMHKVTNLPSVKFGIFEGKLLSDAQVIRISTLPPKNVLLGQVVGSIKSPLFGLHRALNWNLQKLVLTLNAISAQKA